MKKVLLTLALCLSFIGFAQAQLSEGEVVTSKIATGNRPQADDWGIYFGPSYSEIVDLIKSANADFESFGFPLINLKYYATDRLEIRAGIQYNGTTSKSNGTYQQTYYLNADGVTQNIPVTDNRHNRRFRISPGVVYHFSPTNILDVYVGTSIPIGFDGQEVVYQSQMYLNQNNTLSQYPLLNNSSYNSFVIGINSFIGLQAFVADLPLSLGFEYGLSGLLRTGQKVYHQVTDPQGVIQSYYTPVGNAQQFTQFDSKKYYMGSDLRFTISYYFNNK